LSLFLFPTPHVPSSLPLSFVVPITFHVCCFFFFLCCLTPIVGNFFSFSNRPPTDIVLARTVEAQVFCASGIALGCCRNLRLSPPPPPHPREKGPLGNLLPSSGSSPFLPLTPIANFPPLHPLLNECFTLLFLFSEVSLSPRHVVSKVNHLVSLHTSDFFSVLSRTHRLLCFIFPPTFLLLRGLPALNQVFSRAPVEETGYP